MIPYKYWIAKRRVEDIAIFPFVLLGRIVARLRPLEREYRVFFFFPFYHTGGAEKIHAQIAQVAGGADCIIFFTRKSQADTFLDAFRNSECKIRDISKWTDNKALYFLNLTWRGILSGWINRQKQAPTVFQGHSNIAYKTAPWVRRGIKQVDLVHSFNTFSRIRIPFIPFYSETVLISQVKQQAHEAYYQQIGVPDQYLQRFRFIANAVALPVRDEAAKPETPFTVVFSGRPGPEKRMELFLRIAKSVQAKDPSIRFRVMGARAEDLPGVDTGSVEMLGNLTELAQIHQCYWTAQALVLTSSTEGMPLVVAEAMGNGCAILATPVGDLPLHINEASGLVFSGVEDENRIVEEATEYLFRLRSMSSGERAALVHHNIQYAQQHFSMTAFTQAYRSLLHFDKRTK